MANVQPVQPGHRGYGEFQFLKIMAEEIEKGCVTGSTFRKEHQLYVYRKFRSLFGPIYSDHFLRSKFKHLKKRYHEFSELLNQEKILWYKTSNIVYGDEKLLKEKCKVNLHFKILFSNNSPLLSP